MAVHLTCCTALFFPRRWIVCVFLSLKKTRWALLHLQADTSEKKLTLPIGSCCGKCRDKGAGQRLQGQQVGSAMLGGTWLDVRKNFFS